MENAAQQWGRRALDFVDAVEQLSAPEIIQLFEAEIKACGFHAYIMAGLPSPGTLLSDLAMRDHREQTSFLRQFRATFLALQCAVSVN